MALRLLHSTSSAKRINELEKIVNVRIIRKAIESKTAKIVHKMRSNIFNGISFKKFMPNG